MARATDIPLRMFCAALALSVLIVTPTKAAEAEPEAAFRGFVRTYCFECHDNATAEAKLSLESLSMQPADFARWIPVFDKLRLGQMPPKEHKQPAADERRQMTDRLGRKLQAASRELQQAEGRVVLRRLNVTEYETTLRDLLGRQVAVREFLPEETVKAGFDNVSDVLNLSSVHLLRYQEAAEQALATVVPRRSPQPIKSRLTGREVAAKARDAPIGVSLRIEGDVLFCYAITYNHIPLGTATVPQPGRYIVRASLFATNNAGQPLPVRFSPGKSWGRNPQNVLAVRDVAEGKPQVIEQEVELGTNDLAALDAWTLPSQRTWGDRKLSQGKPLTEYTGPGLAIEWLEIEGPLDPFPPAGYTRLFGDLPLKSRSRGSLLGVESAHPREDAARLMRAFLPQAFRRPVKGELADYYTQIVLDALDKNKSFEQAMLLGYRAALCSPHFLYLTEPLRTRAEQPAALDDYAVAARLSYFFWSSLPDRELIELAAKGELTKPAELNRQVERLLADSRSRRFTDHFVGQWLDLRKIDDTTPDPSAYAEFDDFLFWSMPQETTRFFEEILAKDRSLTEFTHSDWTFLNERLAQHYGVPGVFGGELRMVPLPPSAHRGGVMTQANILKVTADGAKTSPVLRGKWVLDRILGQPPAPPPANVPAVEPDIRGATTIRQQLDKHRSNAACNACHQHIDPPGFALESYDPIGSWREFYRAPVYKREKLVKLTNYPQRQVVRGLDIETSGATADGHNFSGIDEYKQLLLADQDQLARCLTEKLVIYATGAELQFADREVLEDLVAKSRKRGYGFRSLIHDLVQSRLFLHK